MPSSSITWPPTAAFHTSRPCSAVGLDPTLFYLGINLGAVAGPLITGLLQTRAGFHCGFGAAAVGMALGLAQFVAFRRNLGTHGRIVLNPLPRRAIGWVIGVIVSTAVVIVASVTTRLAPEAFRAQMMALYFFSVGLGNSMSGGWLANAIAPWISRPIEGVQVDAVVGVAKS